jgi:hypothetical protein
MTDELAQMREAIGDVAERLNDALTAALGNITIAKMYLMRDDTSIVAARKSLTDAEALFPEMADLTQCLLDICDPRSPGGDGTS